MNDNETFTAAQAADANGVLRRALGLGPQALSTQQFVGMISEEIEQLRAAGTSDEQICALLQNEAGLTVSVDALRRFYSDETERTGYP